jgi:hypothetical protein
VIAEGDEESMGEQASSQPGGLGGEARLRRGEGDLLAERRARRAAESGEHALMLRAEAAEATVRTLETHVASLQRRLHEAEDEGRRMSELIVASQPVPQRVPAREEAGAGPPHAPERERGPAATPSSSATHKDAGAGDPGGAGAGVAGTEIDHLLRRLSASEGQAHILAVRLEAVQRQLADAEQAAAVERAAARRAQQLVHERLDTLERKAGLLGSGLDAERTARERAERVLERIRRGQGLIEELVRELAGIVSRLLSATAGRQPAAAERPSAAAPPLPGAAPNARPGALGAGAPGAPAAAGPAQPGRAPASGGGEARAAEMATALAEAVDRLRARAEADSPGAGELRQPRVEHRHSRSLIGRIRIARKQRRERR